MATNKYVNTNQEAGSKAMGGASFPGQILALTGTYEKTALDTDGSVLRLGTVPANAIPMSHSFMAFEAIAGLTDVDVGTYAQSNGAVDGVVADKDCLSDGLDPHAGAALGTEIRAFQAVGIDELGQDLRTLSGGSVGDGKDFYDVALTLNTGGANTGTIAWELYFLLPQS